MASTQNPAVTLEGLVARTWSLPLTVGRSPRGLSVPVSSTSFYDGQRPEEIREDTVLLAVGVDVDGTDGKEAIRVAGAANAAAIVFKSDGPISETLAAVSDHTGVALLSVGQELAWEEVYSMIHLSLLAPETLIPEFRGDDLTSLANALASVAGGPVIIDDPFMRVLAYSVADGAVDPVRQESILGRSLSPKLRKRMEADGAFRRLWTPGEIVRWKGIPEDGYAAPRMGMAIHSGTEVLGVIWIAQGDREFDALTESALRETARSAILPILNYQVGHDATYKLRKNLVLSVLDGQASREIVVDSLRFADRGYLVVFAIAVAGPSHNSEVLSTERAQRLLELQLGTRHTGRLELVPQGQALYGLMQFETCPEDGQLERILGQTFREVEPSLHVVLRAGIGSIVTSLKAVRQSKEHARAALNVLDENDETGPVETYSGVRSQIFLASLTRMLRARPDIRLDSLNVLYQSDQKQATDYIDTLRAYLDKFGDISAAASVLHVHPNTLRYRLRRIREVSGIRIHDPLERLVTELHLRCGLYGDIEETIVEPYS